MDHYASVSWDFFAEHDSKFLLNVEQAQVLERMVTWRMVNP